MKVKDLIKILKAVEDTDMEVCFKDHNYGACDVVKVEITTLTENSGVGVLFSDQ